MLGVVTVPDERLKLLGDFYHSKKVTPAVIEFVDIAGLVKGASKGEGLGNQFLANIREVDAIVHVVRCFEDPNVIHVDGSIDPLRDIETINLELIFSDIEILETTNRQSYQNSPYGQRGCKRTGFPSESRRSIWKTAIWQSLWNLKMKMKKHGWEPIICLPGNRSFMLPM